MSHLFDVYLRVNGINCKMVQYRINKFKPVDTLFAHLIGKNSRGCFVNYSPAVAFDTKCILQ